jgi:tetratricopeptide (TPR) repeat protein
MERGDKQMLEQLEKIDNYLSGDLGEKDRRAFEAAIKADPELAKDVEMNRIVNEALKDKKLLSLQEDIDESIKLIRQISSTVEVDHEKPGIGKPKTKSSLIFSRKYLAIAASVAIFIIISVFALLQYQQSTSPDNLVVTYLEEPYKSPPFFKGSEAQGEDWAINYQKGNYREAKAKLEDIVASGATQLETEFYLGLCYLYQENPDPQNAIQQFEKVLNSNNRYNEQALWYLGLAYYLDNRKEAAVETLRKVTDYKKQEAEKLLERIE